MDIYRGGIYRYIQGGIYGYVHRRDIYRVGI